MVIGVENIFAQTPPSNDKSSNAIILFPSSSCNFRTGTTYGATQSQPVSTYGWCSMLSTTYAYDVWYKFTATCPKHHVQVQSASDFAAIVEVEDAASGEILDCDTDGEGGSIDISVSCIIGNIYYIRVYNDYGGNIWATGTDFQICVTPTCVSNDDCTFATPLISENYCNYISGSTNDATQSQSPEKCSNFVPYAAFDVWYKFTAVKDNHIIKVSGSPYFEPIIVLEDATCSTALWCEEGFGYGSTATMNLKGFTIGNIYNIRVYSSDTHANFQICITHSGSSGIEGVNSLANLKIFPNPNNGIFTVSTTTEIDNIEIYNVLGVKVYSKSTSYHTLKEIDISNEPKGLYLIKMYNGENVYTEKIIIQ